MSNLYPYSGIAVFPQDQEISGEQRNTKAGAEIRVYNEAGTLVTTYSDSLGNGGLTVRTTDSNGSFVFYIEGGVYRVNIDSTNDTWVTIGSGEILADVATSGDYNDLINRPSQDVTDFENLSNSNRPPSRSDYYQTDNAAIWQHEGRLWSPSRTTAGVRASWTRINDNIPNIFSAASNCIGAYYTKKVNPDYTGSCMRVRNGDNNAETDIGFDSNGNIDIAHLRQATGGSKGRVVTWYDQSGNANDLVTLGTNDNQPVISNYVNKRGFVSVIFERPVVSGSVETPEHYLGISTAFNAGLTNAMSMCVLTSAYHSYLTTPFVEVGSGTDSVAMGMSSQTGVQSMQARQNNSPRISSGYMPQAGQSLYTASFSSSGINMYFNDEESKNATGTALGGLTALGVTVGGGIDGYATGGGELIYGGTLMDGLSIYDKGISLLEHRRLFRSLCRHFDLKPQGRRGNIVFDGDSIVEGHGGEQFMNWARDAMDLSKLDYNCYIVGRGGATISAQLAIQSAWLSNVYKSAYPFNIAVIAIGTNDLGNGDTANDIYTGIQTYISNANAVGFDVVIATILPRSSFIGNSKETERISYNNLIRNNFASIGAVGIIDWDLEGTMGNTANVSNTVYYSDGTHPTTYGYSLLATFAEQEIESIVKSLL